MVMRRVFNHHVCLCVLSTAILAGLALMTSQTKVYAQAQNCKGLAGGGDESDKPIVCDGKGPDGSGDKGVLSGKRDIDMNEHSGAEAAVTVTGANTKIRIVAPLTVTDKSSASQKTGIKVDRQGKLTLVGGVSVEGVQKGIMVSDSGSSVTVMTGSIGVRAQGGGPLIEVKNSGKVVLMEEVTVGTISGNNAGEVVINNGGDVMLMGTRFNNVKMGMVVKGTKGTATVRGGGATITLQGSGSKGLVMEGTATANVMDMTINGSGNGAGTTGAEVTGSGTLTLNSVTLKQLETGARVSNGTLKMTGDSAITVGQNGTGVEVLSGKANVTNTAITLQGDGGKGVKVNNGKVTMMGGSITGGGNGTGATGLEMEGSADVTLTSVNVLNVQKGITKGGSGALTLNGTTKIQVAAGGKGLNIAGSGTVTMSGTEITAGNTGTGLNVGGTANVTLMGVTMKQVATGIVMEGTGMLTMSGTTTINVEQGGMGLKVTGSGNVVMTGTLTITGKGNGTGMSVSNGTVTMEGKTMINVAAGGTGLNVSGGTVMMKDVNISGFTKGVEMSGGKRLTVEGGRIEGNGRSGVGINVTGGGDVTVERVNISEVERGIKMEGSGNLTVKDGSITGSGRGGVGIDAKSGSGNVTVDGVNVSGFTTGIYMEAGESLTVKEGTTIDFGHSGTGVEVGTSVSKATLTGVTITGSRGSGKGVWLKGGAVVMDRVGITLQGSGTGVEMGAGVTSAELTDVQITGVERGIKMEGSGEFTVSETTIQFTGSESYEYGIKVGESVKKAELTGVTIVGRGGGGNRGGWVKGGEVKLTRVNVSNVGTGVLMEEKVTSATLTNVKIERAERGISMKGSGTLTVEEVGISFTGSDGYDYGIGVGGSVKKATLTDVKIEGQNKGIGVLIMGGTGNATLTRVNVSQVEMGIFAVGGVLMVSGGEIKEVEKGIWVTGGTLIMKEGTKIQFTKDYGIKVGKSVSKATLTGVTITGKGSGGSGVFMMGGEVTMERVNVSQVATGVYAMGGVLMVSGGEIKGVEDGITMTGYGVLMVKKEAKINFTGEHGVYVGKRVKSTSLIGVTITGNKSGTGIYAEGGEVTVKGTTTITGVEEGIAMTEGKSLTVKDNTRIEFTGNYGVYVGKRVRSTSLMGVTIEGKGSGGYGVYVTGGNLTVIGGEIKEVEDGIMMMGNGVLKVRDNTRIWFTKDYGVVVGESVASTTLTNVQIEGKGSGGNGTGIYAMGGSLTVSGGSITGVEEGIAMMEGTLTVEKGARINFTGKYGYGIYVGKGVMANLMGVTIEGKGSGNGNGYGVLMTGGRSLTVSGGSIKGVKAGIFAVGGGRLTVKDSTRIEFTGSDGYGVYAGKKVTAKLTDVTITGSGDGYGIEVMGGKALLEEVTIEGLGTSGTGLYMTEGTAWLKETHLRDVAKGMTITKGVTIMEKGSVEFTRDYGIDLTRGYAFLGGVNIKGKETGQEGIKVNEGMLDLYKTNVRGVYKGMTVTKGDVVMVEGSVEFKGEHGIYFKQGRAALKGVTMTYKGDNRDAQGANTASPNFIKVEDGVVLAEKLTMTGNGKDNIQGVKVANGGAVWLKNTTFSNVRSGMTVERGVLCAWREEVLPLQEAMVSVFQGGRLC
ncbi:right-handed parallel beta-helix repeat-containing protein [Bartonella schoenbuchensis]|uniref:right-handed parallel beta-helix repeat-containing protein n=1 Tax=Bartonella schoenbuchensis TaxID=165694 RepID=UPI0031450020